MKKNLYIVIFISFIVIGWLLQDKCSKPNDLPIIDNSELKDSVKKLKSELAILSVFNDSLTNHYADVKNIKDSVVYRTKTKYITIFDTITNDTIDCLPKPHVDTIINTYENVIKAADSMLVVKDTIIKKQEHVISVQDTIISNHEKNEATLIKQLNKEKRKGWARTFIGSVGGFLVGKAF